MRTIRWGIIGCGDVTEVKSGPSLYKAEHSKILVDMRRIGALEDAGVFQPLRGPGDAGSGIENKALGLREGGKNGAQQNAVAAADIDDAAGS